WSKSGVHGRRGWSRLSVMVVAATISAAVGVTGITASPAGAAAPGTITTVAGGDAPGPVPATNVAFGGPIGITTTPGGDIYVTDDQFSVIRKVTSAGTETVVAGNGSEGSLGDGGPATEAEFSDPEGVVADDAGNMVIADLNNNAIRLVDGSTGKIVTIAGDGTSGYAGDGGPSSGSKLNAPFGVALDPAANVIIADTVNDAVRVVALSTGTYYGVAMTAGNIYPVAGGNGPGLSGDGGPGAAATLYWPESVAVDSSGNIVIADSLNNAIRVLAGATGTFYGQ